MVARVVAAPPWRSADEVAGGSARRGRARWRATTRGRPYETARCQLTPCLPPTTIPPLKCRVQSEGGSEQDGNRLGILPPRTSITCSSSATRASRPMARRSPSSSPLPTGSATTSARASGSPRGWQRAAAPAHRRQRQGYRAALVARWSPARLRLRPRAAGAPGRRRPGRDSQGAALGTRPRRRRGPPGHRHQERRGRSCLVAERPPARLHLADRRVG